MIMEWDVVNGIEEGFGNGFVLCDPHFGWDDESSWVFETAEMRLLEFGILWTTLAKVEQDRRALQRQLLIQTLGAA